MWLTLIIDTQVYSELQTALGIKLHRRYGVTEPAADQEARALRLSTMKCLYKNFFYGAEPLGPAYPQMQQMLLMPPQPVLVVPDSVTINIRLLTGKATPVVFPRNTTIFGVKIEVMATQGMAVESQRLICAGKELNGELVNGKTLEEYRFVDQDTIYLLHR